MQHLADVVLGSLWFLEFSEDDECDPDFAVEEAARISLSIEDDFSEGEKVALQDAAAQRLQMWLREPGEHGSAPLSPRTSGQKACLESLAAGCFNGCLPEGQEAA